MSCTSAHVPRHLVAISIDQLVRPVVDDVGFVYHGVTFENEKKVYDETNGVMSL
jgi:hypothetical protein